MDSTSDDSSERGIQSSAPAAAQSYLNKLSDVPQIQTRNTVDGIGAVTIETTSSTNDSEDSGVPLSLETALYRFEVVEYWVEQVKLERQDTEAKENLCPYPLQEENCGSIFEWPWVQTELPGAWRQPSLTQSSILEASSKSYVKETPYFVPGSNLSDVVEANAETKIEQSTSTSIENSRGALHKTSQVNLLEEQFDSSCIIGNEVDIKQPTSSVLECPHTHLRGGGIPIQNHYRPCLRRIKKRNLHDHFHHDIDLGYGGSHFAAEPFPKYDPIVDLTYLYETDGIYRVGTYISPTMIRKRREMLKKALGLAFEKAIHNIRCCNSGAESNVDLISEQPLHSIRGNGYSVESNLGYCCGAMSQPYVNLDPGYSDLGTGSSCIYLRGGVGDTDGNSPNPINSTSAPSRRIRIRDQFCVMLKNPLKFIIGKFSCKKPTQTAQGGDYVELEEDHSHEEPEEKFEEEVAEKNISHDISSKEDEYQRVMNDYNLLLEQINEIKTSLREIEEVLPEDCEEVRQYRSIRKDEKILENFDKRMVQIDRKKYGPLDIKSNLKLIDRACREANVVKGIFHRRRDLARIAWRKSLYSHSESTSTLLRGGAGPSKRFQRRHRMGIQEFAKFESENGLIEGPASTSSQMVEPGTPTQTVVPSDPPQAGESLTSDQAVVSPNPAQAVESVTPTETVVPSSPPQTVLSPNPTQTAERPALQTHQQHDSLDSGVGGLRDAESQEKDESAEDEPAQVEDPVPAHESSQPQSEYTVVVVEIAESSGEDNVEQSSTIENSYSIEESKDAEELESVEDSDDFEESKSFEGPKSVNETGNAGSESGTVESSDLEEPERFARQRLERAREQLERQEELRDEIGDVAAEFYGLVNEIAFKRKAILDGDPFSKADFEYRVTDEDVSDITRYIKYKWDMTRILDDTTFYPYQVTRAENCVIGARRVKDIIDNWYAAVVQRGETSRFEPVTTRGVGILDNWEYVTTLPETWSCPTLRRRSSADSASPSASQPKAVVKERGESSKSSARLPFRRAYPVIEERGESSKSNAHVDDWKITAQINELEAKNGIEVTSVSRRSSKDHSNNERDAKITSLSEKAEEEEYQPQIPEQCIGTLTVLGASRAEAVNLLIATDGDVQHAANIFVEEDPLLNNDAYDLLEDAEADINGLVALMGVSPRKAFIALLVSGDDVEEAARHLSADSTYDADDEVTEASNDDKVVDVGKKGKRSITL